MATAESCTGGLLGKRLTDMAGSSAYFLEGFVTYTNGAKMSRLGVAEEVLARFGAVSEETARAMAAGCRSAAGADFALSVTGIAGPGGGTRDKPVGLVFVGLAGEGEVRVRRCGFGSHLSRDGIRQRSCHVALDLLRRALMET